MTDCNLEKIDVRYSQSPHWLFLHVFTGDQCVNIPMCPDPIPDLIKWLEAILTDVMEDSFIIEGEDPDWELKFVNQGNDQIMLLISPADCGEQHVQLRAIANKRQVIDAFYVGLKDFANSNCYTPWQ